MSDSRLEKFIYAICSMEVSDLPAPLSRIEKLWNCLITGETPDFEPLSRNEKYLMAMLDRYDISNLPAPMSRGEKLLYKIAVGETDLSDVPGYLSRYEELLKYLIENGGIGFEYVLYTLNQSLSTLYSTAEKPVKSAILTGQTLVNLATENSVQFTTASDWKHLKTKQKMLNTTKNYMVKFNSSHDYKGYVHLRDKATNTYITDVHRNNFKKGSNVVLLGRFLESDLESFSNICITFFSDSGSATNLTITDVMLIEYQEDMENWGIPYFEGMQSVKMPVLSTVGKNLFNLTDIGGYVSLGNGVFRLDSYHGLVQDYKQINLEPNTQYTLSFKSDDANSTWLLVYIGDKKIESSRRNAFQFTTDSTGIIKLKGGSPGYAFDNKLTMWDVQLEKGAQATPYEPYKSNILTVNEDVTLRGIGNVRDTLDCLTGEVTQRIGEIVLDGSEEFIKYPDIDGFSTSNFYTQISSDFRLNSNLLCDKLKVSTVGKIQYNSADVTDEEAICINLSYIKFRINKSKASTVDELKSYLNSNPITVQCLLTTESIKTVDLTTVDQDGQPTRLKTFNDITYVKLSSEGLIPSVDVEVATKISETLSTMGPQQLDISETQDQLGQTIKEQTENTDATMMATTEIYEQTL